MTATAIVLTGSITPAVNFVAISDIAERRKQYLAALEFYRGFAPVFFLENSTYDLSTDPDFTMPGVMLRKFSMLPERERGKGYQEFAMMDAWHASEIAPPARFLKITGRYRVENVSYLLRECDAAAPEEMLIDRYRRRHVALTSIFSVSWGGYPASLRGLYRQMNDARGVWAEHVFYKALAGKRHVRPFATESDMRGISGSTGQALECPAWKRGVKQVLRRLDAATGATELRWRG